MKVGFIGQGWIGKNYADSFEERGFSIVRYSKEEPFVQNKNQIPECDVVFIAVPTPTTPTGFNFDAVRSALSCVGKGKIAVIKSTILPGTTRILQQEFPDITVLCSPEFLREAHARQDVDAPERTIVGITSDAQRVAVEEVVRILPHSPYTAICTAEEAELTKYAGNVFLYIKVVYMNMLYDLAGSLGADWETVAKNLAADSRIGSSHMHPVHASGHSQKKGRGAGGHCFIKDFAAFADLYKEKLPDVFGVELLSALAEKNNDLLKTSGKDLDLLNEVYGINAS